MSKAFVIDFEWLERYTPDEAERFTFADIKMSVGGVVITELEDMLMPKLSGLLHVSLLMQ